MITVKHYLALLGFLFVAAWIGFDFGRAVLCLVGAVIFYLIGEVLQGELDLGEMQALVERVKKVAQGAALMTETSVELRVVSGMSNLLGNGPLERAMFDNLQRLGPPPFDAGLPFRARYDYSADGALRSIEDLAQLLALWKPGVYSKEREEAYFDARFAARERPSYPHPAMATVLDKTYGQVLYADQLVELVKLLGFDHAWAERFRRAIAGGRAAGRDVMERAIREAGARQRWTKEQSNALVALLIQHVGYLHLHGHALTMAQHVFRQACLKVDAATAPLFFAEVLNNGGSIQYGLGSAVEEARRFGVLLLPPCINQSNDRFKVEQATVESRGTIGAVRVPLTAIRGLGPETAQHCLAVRAAFGDYTSLLDFCRKVDRRLVSRHDVLLLIKLGAFGFTGLSRAQLAAAEQYYTSLADVVRYGDGDPSGLSTIEENTLVEIWILCLERSEPGADGLRMQGRRIGLRFGRNACAAIMVDCRRGDPRLCAARLHLLVKIQNYQKDDKT